MCPKTTETFGATLLFLVQPDMALSHLGHKWWYEGRFADYHDKTIVHRILDRRKGGPVCCLYIHDCLHWSKCSRTANLGMIIQSPQTAAQYSYNPTISSSVYHHHVLSRCCHSFYSAPGCSYGFRCCIRKGTSCSVQPQYNTMMDE